MMAGNVEVDKKVIELQTQPAYYLGSLLHGKTKTTRNAQTVLELQADVCRPEKFIYLAYSHHFDFIVDMTFIREALIKKKKIFLNEKVS